ncbi:uncharacterized protein [Elaeis guineensis]|uniref:uncharacterized protein n=1 Tax=Elaeis guineensis var. tenera TaxID=51953 RepID=UPI003C6D1D56
MMIKSNYSDELIITAQSSNNIMNRYNGFVINGFKFHTKKCEKFRKTKNNDIIVEADGKTYYDVLMDMFELDYYEKFKIILFQCNWLDINSPKGLKQDTNGFTLVNFSRLIHTDMLLKDDSFIFSSQARQVFFFVQNSINKEWVIVVRTKSRDLYDMKKGLEVEDDETYTQYTCYNFTSIDDLNATSLIRMDIEEENIDLFLIGKRFKMCTFII